MDKHEFTNKVAMITGGASGIGKAIAEFFTDRGGFVIILDMDEISGKHITRQINSKGNGLSEFMHCNVIDRRRVKQICDKVVSEHNRIDYLFSSAGIGLNSLMIDNKLEEHWDKIMDVNLTGLINVVQTVYPIMVRQNSGHIINIGSSLSIIPFAMHSVYATSKHGVLGLSNVLRIEGKPHNVKVCCVCPGYISTPHQDKLTYVNFDKEKRDQMLPRPVSSEICVKKIFTGIRKNNPIIVVQFIFKVLWLVYRLFPKFYLDFISPILLEKMMTAYVMEGENNEKFQDCNNNRGQYRNRKSSLAETCP